MRCRISFYVLAYYHLERCSDDASHYLNDILIHEADLYRQDMSCWLRLRLGRDPSPSEDFVGVEDQ